MRTTVTVGCGASLQGAPPPLVACSGSATEVGVELALCAGASIDWRELVVLGRSGESAGTVRLTWDVTVEGRPLLRQCVDLTDPNMVAWPGMLMGQRVIATQLVVGDPDGPIRVAPRTVVRSARAVAQQLDDRSVLLTVLAADAMTAGRELGLLRQAVLPQRSVAS
jgi:urease accessory protein